MGTIISLVIAGFAAYWVFNDAKSRGNSSTYATAWAAGTFFLLIIVLPLYLLFGRKSPKRAIPQSTDADTIDVDAKVVEEPDMHCPMCAKPVREDLIICPYCQNTLKPRCTNCGRELSREWAACPDCGAPAKRK